MLLKSFAPDFIDSFPTSRTILALSSKVAEYRGKQALFQRQVPQVLDTLRQHAVIQSIESSNRIEGITVSSRRFESIMQHATEPENRSEAEIAGYRDVLRTIHVHHAHMRLNPNLILQLHRDLMRYTGSGGKWKSVDNSIEETLPNGETRVRFQPVPAWQTPQVMEELCRRLDVMLDFAELPDALLVSTFVLDFLCIHPFPDGNGRMARLLTLLLLYQRGYIVGRYVSLERVIEDFKERYHESLYLSSIGWHEGKHNITPWTEYFLTMLLEAYHRFEERVGDMESTQRKGWKQDRIRQVISGFVADFTISDLEEKCPGISRPTITRVLNELGRQGVVECIQRGRNAKWVRREGRTMQGNP